MVVRLFKRSIVSLILLISTLLLCLGVNSIETSYSLSDNWYMDYTYVLDEVNDIISLTKYNGNAIEIEVPSSVIIGKKAYKVLVEGGVYSGKKDIESVEFFDGVSAGSSLRRLFYGCENLENVVFNEFDTSNVTTMESMFANCSKLKTLDLSSFDTFKVSNMKNMFHSCSSITALNISSFNTSSLVDMAGMFYGLSKLNKLDISSFDTVNVLEMNDAFNGLSKINEISLGDKTNLKIGVIPSAGNFSRGTWKNVADNKEITAVDIGIKSTTATGAKGTYQKVSNISKELEINFPVTYKIDKISKIDEFSVKSNGKFYMDGNKRIYTVIPLSNSNVYEVPGQVELLINDVVSDELGNKYNLKLIISNIILYDLTTVSGVENVEISVMSVSNNTILFAHKFVNPETNETVFINGNGVSRKQDVEIQIVDQNGNVKTGNYIFSAYDLDLPSVKDSGYGVYGEGINFISGFDTNNISLSKNTFLQLSNITPENYRRITGSRSDNESESSEFLIKADARSSKFQWTAGKTCSTRFFNFYQPQIVEIEKRDVNDKIISGIGLELYKDNVLFKSWETTENSEKMFLNPGKYILKEVKLPNYYQKANDIEFYVDTNDTLTINGEQVKKIVMYNIKKDSSGIIEKHIDEYDNKILDSVEYNGKMGDPYKTESKTFEGYKLIKEPTNKTGIMNEELIEVIYYYRKIYNITTEVNGTGGTIVGEEEVFEGLDSTVDKIVITPDKNHVIEKITINGEEIEINNKNGMTLSNFKKMQEDKKIIVSFSKIPSKVIEKHIDEYDNKILDSVEYNGKMGDPYKTESKTFEGYKLIKEPTNKTGIMNEELIEVIYYYRKIYNITTEVNGTGGTIVGEEEVFEGLDSTVDKIVITPDKNHVIEKITINGEEIEITNKNGMTLPNFKKMQEDKKIEVSFVEFLENVPNTNRFDHLSIVAVLCGMFGILFVWFSKKVLLKTM